MLNAIAPAGPSPDAAGTDAGEMHAVIVSALDARAAGRVDAERARRALATWETGRSFLNFATFVAFFPQLVAGPIVRAIDFLPQLRIDRRFDWRRAQLGAAQIASTPRVS